MTVSHFTISIKDVETSAEAQALLSELQDELKHSTGARLDLTQVEPNNAPSLAVFFGAETVFAVASVFHTFALRHNKLKLEITAENITLAFDPLDISASISALTNAGGLPGDPTIDPPKPRKHTRRE